MKSNILLLVVVMCLASFVVPLVGAEPDETVQVLVAKTYYGQWTPIREPKKMFAGKKIPRKEAPKDYFPAAEIEKLKNWGFIKDVNKDDVLIYGDIQEVKFLGLDVSLRPGKRAFAIKANAETAAGGFVLPGSHVDLIHTMTTEQRVVVSRYVLQHMKVLAVDLHTERPKDKRGILPTATVTLEVSPDEAVKLSRFIETGTMRLVLRPQDDDEGLELEGGPAFIPPPPPPGLPFPLPLLPKPERKN